jgi:hypothetical protein
MATGSEDGTRSRFETFEAVRRGPDQRARPSAAASGSPHPLLTPPTPGPYVGSNGPSVRQIAQMIVDGRINNFREACTPKVGLLQRCHPIRRSPLSLPVPFPGRSVAIAHGMHTRVTGGPLCSVPLSSV